MERTLSAISHQGETSCYRDPMRHNPRAVRETEALARRVRGSLIIYYLAVVWGWYRQERRVMVVAQ
jgi:hypothetical protein